MGFLDRFISPSMKDIPAHWHELNEEEQLNTIIEESKKQPVAIFKHSTSCGISHSIKHRLEGDWDFEANELKFYYLDLLAFRPISNEVANRFGVIHQSPQVIVFKDGAPTFSTSHHGISVSSIRKNL